MRKGLNFLGGKGKKGEYLRKDLFKTPHHKALRNPRRKKGWDVSGRKKSLG